MNKTLIIGENAKLSVKDLAEMVDKVNRFSSDVRIGEWGSMINAKSFMGVMAIGLKNGKEICIEAVGPDEKEAIAALERILLD